MSWYHRIDSATAPFVSGSMDIAVADTAIEDFYLHIMWTKISSVDGKRPKRRLTAAGSESFD
jgi:hypothetical protein